MSNLTIQSTPKTYLDQYPLSTGQVAADEEGIVIGNSGDLNTCLFEKSLNTKLGVENLDEAKTLLDVIPITPMPPEGGITFVTNMVGAMSVTISLCTAATQAQVGGSVTINWGDGTAIATYVIAATGTTTCNKAAGYSTTDQKLVTITCVTSTHSILSFTASNKGLLSIDGRNCNKLTELTVISNNSLKYIFGFSGLISLFCDSCYLLHDIPYFQDLTYISCSSCNSFTKCPSGEKLVEVSSGYCENIVFAPDYLLATYVDISNNPLLKNCPLMPNVTAVNISNCYSISYLNRCDNATNINILNCSSLEDPATFDIGNDPWPKCLYFNMGNVGFGNSSVYLNNFYNLIHDWSPSGGTSGTLYVADRNSGYAGSNKTIATNKDWTLT